MSCCLRPYRRGASALVFATLLTTAAGAGDAISPEVARLASAFDQRLQEVGFEGAFLIGQRGITVFAKGYGFADGAHRLAVTPDTAFWTASVAKQFTAAAVLRLVEMGRLRLEDPVARHLGDLPEAWAPITVHHLLSHTSGITQNYAADGIADREAALRAIAARPLAEPPGTAFHYSNDAYSALAVLVEVASGQPFEAFVRSELFTRAGLSNTGFWAAPPAGALAELRRPQAEENRLPNWGWRGGTGIALSANDLYRWWVALESGGVLARASVDRMLSPQMQIAAHLSCGYGWFQEKTVSGEPALWTRGTDDSGENAILLVLPDRELAIVGLAHSEATEDEREPITRRLAWEAVAMLTATAPAPGR